MRLQKHLISEPSIFDGSQLQPEWMDHRFGEGVEGITAFIGSFRPAADLPVLFRGGQLFQERRLLHLVVRHVHRDVEKLRLQQRLLLDVAKDKLNHRLPADPGRGDRAQAGIVPPDIVHKDIVNEDIVQPNIVQRWGSDLCRGSEHLSVSVVRMTKTGGLVYLGIREPGAAGKPPLATGNGEKLDLLELARAIMDQYIFEVNSARQPLP